MDEDWERLQSTSWELTAYGRSEEYATREDAEMVARALLRDAVVRAAWSGRPIDAVEDTAPARFPSFREWCANGQPCSGPDGRADYDRAKAARERSMGGFGDANPARGLRLVP